MSTLHDLKAGAAVWFREVYGGAPRSGVITEPMISRGGGILGYRVIPDFRRRSDPERGDVFSVNSVFARPDDRERLIRELMDHMDELGAAAKKLANKIELP